MKGTQDNDAWSAKREKEARKLIVWIRHEATYSAERTEYYSAAGVGESRVMSEAGVGRSSESFNVPV